MTAAPITETSILKQQLPSKKRKTPTQESVNEVGIKASKQVREVTTIESHQIKLLEPLMNNFTMDCLAPMKKELLVTEQALECIAKVLETNFNIPKEKGLLLQSLSNDERSSLEQVNVFNYLTYAKLHENVVFKSKLIFECEVSLRIGDKSLLQCPISVSWLSDAVIIIPNSKVNCIPCPASAKGLGKFVRGKKVLSNPSAMVAPEMSQILVKSKLIPDYTISNIFALVHQDIKQDSAFTPERQSAFLEKLVEELTDPVDLVDPFTSAKTLDCGHSFSDKTVRQLNPVRDSDGNEVIPLTRRCPTCQEPFRQENMISNALIDKLVKEVKTLKYDKVMENLANKTRDLKTAEKPNRELFQKVNEYYHVIFDAWNKLKLLNFDRNLSFGTLHQAIIDQHKVKKRMYESMKAFHEGISEGIGFKKKEV